MWGDDNQSINTPPDPESPKEKIARLESTIAEQAKVIKDMECVIHDKEHVIQDKEHVIQDKEHVIKELLAKIECYEKANELKKATEGFRLEMDRGENLPNLLNRITNTLIENQNWLPHDDNGKRAFIWSCQLIQHLEKLQALYISGLKRHYEP